MIFSTFTFFCLFIFFDVQFFCSIIYKKSSSSCDTASVVVARFNGTTAGYWFDKLSGDGLSSSVHSATDNSRFRTIITWGDYCRTYSSGDHSSLHRSGHNGTNYFAACDATVDPFVPTTSHCRTNRCRSSRYEYGPHASIANRSNGSNRFVERRLR